MGLCATSFTVCNLRNLRLMLEVASYFYIKYINTNIQMPSYSLVNVNSKFWTFSDEHFGVWHHPSSTYLHKKPCFTAQYASNAFGMEYGPRALGDRSILGDPRRPEMQKKLNLKIKFREGFRPFAPSVLEEYCAEWFDLDAKSPYMLVCAPVAQKHRTQLPENVRELPLYDRLYLQRSTVPAITHVDWSARIQSVSRSTNPRYWGLIDTFRREQGCPMLNKPVVMATAL